MAHYDMFKYYIFQSFKIILEASQYAKSDIIKASVKILKANELT